MAAVGCGHTNLSSLVQTLLDAGADTTATCKDGKTALVHGFDGMQRCKASTMSPGSYDPHPGFRNLSAYIKTTPAGQQLLDFLQQYRVEHILYNILLQGIVDVEALADVLSDSRLSADWFKKELGMRMGEVVTVLRHARELLSIMPDGVGAKRARREFEELSRQRS